MTVGIRRGKTHVSSVVITISTIKGSRTANHLGNLGHYTVHHSNMCNITWMCIRMFDASFLQTLIYLLQTATCCTCVLLFLHFGLRPLMLP
jgi:hypothetical protein